MSSEQQRLRAILRPGLERVINPRNVRRMATIATAFDDTGRVRPDAIGASLAFSVVTDLRGVVAVGTNVAIPRRLPQGCRLLRLDALARLGPTTGPFTAEVFVNGTFVERVSIASGQTSGGAPLSAVTAEAGAVLTWNIIAAGGAQDVALGVVYAPA